MQELRFHQYLETLGGLTDFARGDLSAVIAGATNDSRSVRPGWLFVAVPGARDDGTRYVQDALGRGAAAVVATVPLDLPAHICFARVTNAYTAAGRIAEAAYGFPGRRLRVLAVTGTNGKTTCAYLLRELLRLNGLCTGMVGTVVYDLSDGRELEADRTTPEPFGFQELLAHMVDASADAVVLEASSHALAQRRMGELRVEGSLFTNLTGDHLDYHGDMDEYFAAKRILFQEYLVRDGVAVVNADDAYGRRLAAELCAQPCRLQAYGCHPSANARVGGIAHRPAGTEFDLHWRDQCLRFSTPLIGGFNVSNLAGGATLALELGVPPALVKESVRQFHGAPGRLQAVRALGDITVLVDYAHTDDALRNVLTALRPLRRNRLTVVFGCGGDRDRSKRPRMGSVAAEYADRIYLTSDNPRSEEPAAILEEIRGGVPANADCLVIEDRRSAIDRAVAEAGTGDLILVAGKGHERYQEQNGKRVLFDDLEEVRAALLRHGLLPHTDRNQLEG